MGRVVIVFNWCEPCNAWQIKRTEGQKIKLQGKEHDHIRFRNPIDGAGLTKREALKLARRICREIYKAGAHVQLLVMNKKGQISEEATYGADPKRYES